VTDVGVACVPGSSFYRSADGGASAPGAREWPEGGRTNVRFCFCKKEETFAAAEERFAALRLGARPSNA
jgi:aminotransferase